MQRHTQLAQRTTKQIISRFNSNYTLNKAQLQKQILQHVNSLQRHVFSLESYWPSCLKSNSGPSSSPQYDTILPEFCLWHLVSFSLEIDKKPKKQTVRGIQQVRKQVKGESTFKIRRTVLSQVTSARNVGYPSPHIMPDLQVFCVLHTTASADTCISTVRPGQTDSSRQGSLRREREKDKLS